MIIIEKIFELVHTIQNVPNEKMYVYAKVRENDE